MKKRTAEQQARYYEVGETANDFFEYLIDCKLCGNHTEYIKLYKEMFKDDQKLFKDYLIDRLANLNNTASDMYNSWIYSDCLKALS